MRRTEKKLLNDINNDTSGRLRFHVLNPNGKIKKRIQTVEEKMFVLINDALSGEPSTLDFTLSQVFIREYFYTNVANLVARY